MDNWNDENTWEQSEIHIDQLTGEIDQILHKIINELGELGIAYGIIREFSYAPEEPPTWTISIEDSKTVLTLDILFQYMSQHRNIRDALTHFMHDHFPYFT
ncbi:hypothetical protein PPOLYM_02562 [Paenibacillus polymyxa]|uniref:hypothetical protein n=1 Tax=Paenibacillus polymyxa TaxID=1406 RepID=UPI0009473C2B|nr:hypothetical protein [Paenibacillus polymyxa]APQ59811.1 hypothetical protein VK72_14395 [Paenibacillus polymyxa]VUG06169.1 hypothetical protein PPOLYM_02562 [Paenibacillus polymyxa]